MVIKRIVREDLSNYKKPSMLIATARCTFKCDEPNRKYCQNRPLFSQSNIDMDDAEIVKIYISNNLTQALVFGGLEPFDQYDEMIHLIHEFRKYSDDDVVIYTGYTKNEIQDQVNYLEQHYKNIVVKFGRYIPNQKPHYDPILGVDLASNNQYAKKIS